MSLENEMRHEMYKLESDIYTIDEEIKKLDLKMTSLINVKKKKEHDLRVLRETFNEIPTASEEVQLDLSRILREKP